MATTYDQLEPAGFGRMPFGDPSTDDDIIEYGRGFGDPLTDFTEDTSE